MRNQQLYERFIITQNGNIQRRQSIAVYAEMNIRIIKTGIKKWVYEATHGRENDGKKHVKTRVALFNLILPRIKKLHENFSVVLAI